jgi:hypothetical protein
MNSPDDPGFRERLSKLEARSIKHNLYERITVSLRTVDAVIIGCAAAIIILVIVGMYIGRGLKL